MSLKKEYKFHLFDFSDIEIEIHYISMTESIELGSWGVDNPNNGSIWSINEKQIFNPKKIISSSGGGKIIKFKKPSLASQVKAILSIMTNYIRAQTGAMAEGFQLVVEYDLKYKIGCRENKKDEWEWDWFEREILDVKTEKFKSSTRKTYDIKNEWMNRNLIRKLMINDINSGKLIHEDALKKVKKKEEIK